MKNADIDSVLDDLLSSWHKWSAQYQYGKGYPSTDIACRQARISRQYDDENGALDASVENSVMEAFDAAMDRIEQPWRTALSIQARNFATGARVWSSPRLPADPMERAILTTEARNRLMRELAVDGILN
jgi:hypothetical protein